MTLNLDQLRAFLEIYQQRSIGRAALALDYPQPALSRMLRTLEDKVGAKLFERRSSGVVPTLAADTLKPFAQEIVTNSTAALGEITSLLGGEGGIVRVGATASIASRVLPGAITEHRRRWPNARFHVSTGIDDQINAQLSSCQIDVAIVGRLEEGEVPVSHVRLGSDEIRVMARPEHPLHLQEPIDLADLAQEAWLLAPRDTSVMRQFDAAFRSHGLTPPPATVETRSLAMARSLLASCDLIGWLPVDVDIGRAQNLVELPIPELALRSDYFLCRRAHGLLPMAVRRFIDVLLPAAEWLPVSGT